MAAITDVETGNSPRLVGRGVNSLTKTEVSVHWLRISFPDKYLRQAMDITNKHFDLVPLERFGLWGYDRAYHYANGVKILFDTDDDKARIHNHRAYFECPGRACDELTPADLVLLMQIFKDAFEGRGERIDICLDDFSRHIDPQGLRAIAMRRDYSRFRQFHLRQSFDNGNELVYDSIVFGSQKKGWVKQLEVYDKKLESNGQIDSVRWEAKFREDKADTIFTMLAGTSGNLDSFALLCGSIVVGCITFIHRIDDVKNLSRLDEYDFWKLIKGRLGDLRIRSHKKVNTITGIVEWVKRQVAPNLACLSKVFQTEKIFLSWIFELVHDGESRLNPNQLNIVDRYSGSFDHRSYMDPGDLDNRYVKAIM